MPATRRPTTGWHFWFLLYWDSSISQTGDVEDAKTCEDIVSFKVSVEKSDVQISLWSMYSGPAVRHSTKRTPQSHPLVVRDFRHFHIQRRDKSRCVYATEQSNTRLVRCSHSASNAHEASCRPVAHPAARNERATHSEKAFLPGRRPEPRSVQLRRVSSSPSRLPPIQPFPFSHPHAGAISADTGSNPGTRSGLSRQAVRHRFQTSREGPKAPTYSRLASVNMNIRQSSRW